MKIYQKIESMSMTQLCLIFMAVFNFIVVCFMVLVPGLTQLRASQDGALDFLGSLVSIPFSPSIRIFLVIGCYILIIFCMLLKYEFYKKEDDGFFWLSYYEIFLVAGLSWLLEMSYNGVIFLIVAEFLYYMGNRKNWIGFMILSFVIYLLCNYNLVSIVLPFNSFEMWAAYYGGRTESYLLGIKTLCELINIMTTLVFVSMVILADKREKKKIRELNFQLESANASLKDVNEQLHDYAVQKEQMGEMKERNRLAREIHDTLGHILTGISVGVDAVLVLMDLAPDAAKEQLNTIGDMARNGLNDVRRSVRKLKPDSLESKSIDLAIHDMVEETAKTTGAKIYFVSYGSGLQFETDEEETIFRLVQEGTTNALRHGNATEIWIRLDKHDMGVEISLADNGSGSEHIQEGFGLSHMRERVEMLGGSITFSSDNGFRIHAVIPIRKSQ